MAKFPLWMTPEMLVTVTGCPRAEAQAMLSGATEYGPIVQLVIVFRPQIVEEKGNKGELSGR